MLEGLRPLVSRVSLVGLFWLFVFTPSNIKPPELSATEVGFFLLLSLVVLNRQEIFNGCWKKVIASEVVLNRHSTRPERPEAGTSCNPIYLLVIALESLGG